jgi:hypothetical protein
MSDTDKQTKKQKDPQKGVIGERPIDPFEYQGAIWSSRIDGIAKSLLGFYSWAYGWKKGIFSHYEEQRIAAHVGISVSTLHKKRKYLEQLGWIKVHKRRYDQSPLIEILYGNDDPDFEGKSCSKWTPENKCLSPEILSKMSSEELVEYHVRINARYRTTLSAKKLQDVSHQEEW